jgi:hypothetical protein
MLAAVPWLVPPLVLWLRREGSSCCWWCTWGCWRVDGRGKKLFTCKDTWLREFNAAYISTVRRVRGA